MAKRRYLLVEKGPLSGDQFDIDAQPVLVGRGKACRIRLDDSWCSREHCVFEYRADGTWMVDLGSKNGTSINGILFDEKKMRPGDRVILGQVTMLYLEQQTTPSSGSITEEDDEEETQTFESLQLPLTQRGAAQRGPAERQDPVDAGAMTALRKVGAAAQSAREIGPFFERTLAVLLEETTATDGGLALLDPESALLTHQVTTGDEGVFKSALTDAVVNRREVSMVGKPRASKLIGAPLWFEQRVVGLLCLKLPPSSDQINHRFLLLMGVLGDVVGGAAGRLTRDTESAGVLRLSQPRFGMVGESAAMHRVFETLERIAPTDASVLVSGESGTGKELVARAIHQHSKRGGGPFVTLNAASLPIELVESELFGHEKGAFTGATAAKPGQFELSNRGTFFLDEIGELDIRVQAKLLRVLEDGTFGRVGGTETLHSDTRIIAATNRDLQQAVADGAFREDLYFRLRVIEITLPPLRERREDIPLLVQHMVTCLADGMGRAVEGVTEDALSQLEAYHWPGNVRELRNCIERALVMTSGGLILPTHLELSDAPPPPPGSSETAELPSLRELERAHIRRILELTEGNKSKAARMLGIDRSTLYQKLKEMPDL